MLSLIDAKPCLKISIGGDIYRYIYNTQISQQHTKEQLFADSFISKAGMDEQRNKTRNGT